MSATYTVIITAIDAAIQAGVSKPGSLTVAGQTIQYRSLVELIETRNYYQQLLNQSSTVRDSFKIAQITSGGA